MGRGEELDGIITDAKDSDRCEGDGVDGFVGVIGWNIGEGNNVIEPFDDFSED